jgi:hypothetical protein
MTAVAAELARDRAAGSPPFELHDCTFHACDNLGASTSTPAKPARTLPLFRGNAAHVRAAQPDTAALTRQWVDATKPPSMPKSMTLARVHVGHSDWLPDTHLESVASATSSDDAPLISFV